MILAAQLQALQTLIGTIEKRIMAQHRSNEASMRLETIPGIGRIGAIEIAAPDPSTSRDFVPGRFSERRPAPAAPSSTPTSEKPAPLRKWKAFSAQPAEHRE